MRSNVSRMLVFALVVVLSACTRIDSDPWYAELSAFVERELAHKGIPALAITVVDGSEVAWSNGFGSADAGRQAPVSGSSVFRAASLSKLFTAMAVLQLAEKGQINLDAPVTEYLPSFQPRNAHGKLITVRSLISHRSGLVREPPVGNYFDDSSPTLLATVQSLNHTRTIDEPESRTRYSNAAVAVAGMVVTAVTGIPFADYVQASILAPMGMTQSSFEADPALLDDLATGYMWRYDTDELTAAPHFEFGMGPAANLYSTTEDLGRFVSALFAIAAGERPDLMQAGTLDAMWTPQYLGFNATSGFGLGFYITRSENRSTVQHAGAVYGYSSLLLAMPEEKMGVAAFANLDMVGPVVDRISQLALATYLAFRDGTAAPALPDYAPVDSAWARELDGDYGPNTSLVERNGALFLDTVPFRYSVAQRDGNLTTEGRLGVGQRIEVHGDSLRWGESVHARKPGSRPEPPPEHLRGLIGEYGWDHNVLYILEDHGQLYAVIEWFFRYPLTEIADNRFGFPGYGLYDSEELTFIRDDSGTATEVSLEGVVFPRRDAGPDAGETFRISPLLPVDSLYAIAMAAAPPTEGGPFREVDLVELASLDPRLRLDIRYATENNFMGTPFYRQPRAFLQRPAAEALVRAHDALRLRGYGLVIYDAYRPWHVTKMFFDATPDALKIFVANPANGSRHNRGCAVDLGLVDLETGEVVIMPSGYDEFTARAFTDYVGGTAAQRFHREILRDAMEEAGFSVYDAEWWHFDFHQWRQYPILNEPFDRLLPGQ